MAAAAEARRRKVAMLRLAGENSETAVARLLGVSVATVCRDFDELNRQWREQANPDDIAVEKGRDVARVEALIASVWEKATDPTNRAQNFYIDRVIALLERRAKLLGFDAPQQVDIGARVRQTAADLDLDPRDIVEGVQEYLRSQRARA